ncbi:hypothetical protein F5Y03DRAFT_216856 [Xylaria venustula]|nr:hypothetical protein F5Y03DRAFT_216856 [Xylaria venustula]
MEEQCMVLDPDGDLLVILRNPDRTTDPSDDEGQPIDPDYSYVTEFEPFEREPSSLKTTIVADFDDETTSIPSDDDSEHEWVFKTSSKHLALSSTYFKNTLKRDWHEATKIHEDGLKHWEVQDFDAKAMEIVLSVIHLRNSTIPRTLHDLDTLVEIARIVDYLECHEAMELYASLWIRGLEYRVPDVYNIELLRWICIAGVFRHKKLFERCTRVAIKENHLGIPTLGLPILPRISKVINDTRMDHLDKVFASVYSLMDSLTQDTICSLECDAFCLGILIKRLQAEFRTPRPKRPYPKMSIDKALRVLTQLSTSVDWSLAPSAHSFCGFNDLELSLFQLEIQIVGLDLENGLPIQNPW